MVHSFILASIGGFLIAVATSLNLYLKGRITGNSGVLYAIWSRDEGSNIWRIGFILGLLCSGSIVRVSSIDKVTFFDDQTSFNKDFSIGAIIISGILVGFGTKLSNGCTSGHGVCGIPRLNWRSYAAVGVFLSSAIGIATLRHHVPFLEGNSFFEKWGKTLYENSEITRDAIYFSSLGIVLLASFAFLVFYFVSEYDKEKSRDFSDSATGLLVGILFGAGLSISGMTKRTRVINFLAISKDWDASLLFVLGVSVSVNFITFYFILKREDNPIFSDTPCKVKPSSDINFNFLFGSCMFGVGWGISGLCPGPVMTNFLLFIPLTIFYTILLIIGQILSNLYVKYIYDNLFKKKEEQNTIINNNEKTEKNNVNENNPLPDKTISNNNFIA